MTKLKMNHRVGQIVLEPRCGPRAAASWFLVRRLDDGPGLGPARPRSCISAPTKGHSDQECVQCTEMRSAVCASQCQSHHGHTDTRLPPSSSSSSPSLLSIFYIIVLFVSLYRPMQLQKAARRSCRFNSSKQPVSTIREVAS